MHIPPAQLTEVGFKDFQHRNFLAALAGIFSASLGVFPLPLIPLLL